MPITLCTWVLCLSLSALGYYACHPLHLGTIYVGAIYLLSTIYRCRSPGRSNSIATVVAQALSTVERDVAKEGRAHASFSHSASFRNTFAPNEGGQRTDTINLGTDDTPTAASDLEGDDTPTSASDLEGVFGIFDEAARNSPAGAGAC